MVYSSRLRKGIGELRAALESAGLGLQDARFARHGEHAPDVDAPLIMVSCSGGRDSMALAAVAAKTCASLGLRCGAIIIDHQLQQGSAGVARATADRCVALGLDPVRVRAIDVPDSRGIGVEAAAREARYHAIVDACSDASAVLLAHTKNDQAETVIIGLLRSAGLDAVCGMNGSFIRDGVRFLRPWLNVTREETTGICEDLRLAWWDDPTNGPDVGDSGGNEPLPANYPLRSRIRHDLMPYLASFAGSDVVSKLALGARLAEDDRAYLDDVAQRVCEQGVTVNNGEIIIDVRALQSQDIAIRRRVIVRSLAEAGISCMARQVEGIDRLICDWHGQKGVNLPSGYSAYRQKHACAKMVGMRIADVQEDIDHELISKEEIADIINHAAAQASEDYRGKNPLLVCVLKGAVNTLAAFSQAMSIHAEMDFMSLSSYGSGTQSSGKITVRQDLSTDVRGRHVLIVEDIIDSGVTLAWLVDELKSRGAASVEIFALLEKPARRKVDVPVKYKGREIPDEFVVGFGLDYDERYRNLDSIAVLKPEVYEGGQA